eukprot:jgi/Tetstr1/438876/TSEL_027385.t1
MYHGGRCAFAPPPAPPRLPWGCCSERCFPPIPTPAAAIHPSPIAAVRYSARRNPQHVTETSLHPPFSTRSGLVKAGQVSLKGPSRPALRVAPARLGTLRWAPQPLRAPACRPGMQGGVRPAAMAAQSAGSPEPPGVPQEKKKVGGGVGERVASGVALGVTGGAVLVAGGWPFVALISMVAYQCAQEFFGFITSEGIRKGMKPPSAISTSAISLCTIGICIGTVLTRGRTGTCLAVAAFIVIVIQLLTSKKPRFAQLSSSIFGIFYCGYLPACWIKLRALQIPAVHSNLAQHWPVALGGPTHITVGLAATFTAAVCIIAADSGAYLVGKTMGRTKLIDISPKKTVEGALGGMLFSVAAASACGALLQWPFTPVSCVVFGILIFFCSLFGDLLESVMKRDAGMKDSGDLIPGHGGLLDRFDSYMLTGAMVYFYTRMIAPFFGI